ncbi:MAG TPA: endonuclease III [Candidatus Babeliales bacterium]|jgi:endonuclease-3|nr:endonuclease III [Candidatus Babeliales bacterium]
MQQKLLERIESIVQMLRIATRHMPPPAAQAVVSRFGRDPFLILISCLLSLRTRDTVSFPASCRLFEYAKTPEDILKISIARIEKIIYPVGFYKRKARTLHSVCQELLEQFEGKVPHTQQELLSLNGVGPKTANLVLAEGFNIPALCVDTHVHRISNRLGIITTKTPKETEAALQKVLPRKYWIEWNKLLVMWGQNICVPISPFCSQCAIFDWCQRRGVTKSR